MVALWALGLVAVVAVFSWGFLTASPTAPCHDCDEILGRWMSPIFVFFFLPANAIAWFAGVMVGAVFRKTI